MRPIASYCTFKNRLHQHVNELGQRYAEQVIPKHIRTEALERLNWHKAQGDEVVVVSASLNVYLTHWCKSMGCKLICSELESQNGKLTGKYILGDVNGKMKAELVKARYDLNAYESIYAYGDTAGDKEMLALANYKFMKGKPV